MARAGCRAARIAVSILTAAGATPRTRRGITAATAAGLVLLGALAGTGVAYLAAAAYFRSQLTGRLGHVPLLDLIAILAGLPAIAAAAGWVFGGREPRSNGRALRSETRVSPR